MQPFLRLRQICLVAAQLEPLIGDLQAILGLNVCYRDPHVGKYGLENALLPVDMVLLEVVSPTQPGTAAGRFLDKTGGRGGYMAIFSCDDPDARGRHAEAMGVRVANVIDHAPYHGVQLHPRDCRAAFIEFNHTTGSDNLHGLYPPAGPDWQASIRTDVTRALVGVEMASPAPDDLAAHWGRILELPVTLANGNPAISLGEARFDFVKGTNDAMIGLTFRVHNAEGVVAAAKARGYATAHDRFHIGGVDVRLVA